ncbi:MAG: cupin [Segetibacter sp.]|nr:cupin [Segetibacter sp.]
MHSAAFQFNNEMPWEDLGNGIERQLFGFNETIMMVKVKFEKGAVGELHSHFHTQVSYVESGSFEMTIGEEKKIINAGDGFYVHPDLVHGTVCLEPGVLVDVFSPARKDFLTGKNG